MFTLSGSSSLVILGTLLAYTIIFIIAVLKFSYDLISFYFSGYKKKSGNGFFKTYFNKCYKGEFLLYKKLIKIFNKEFVFTNLYLDSKNTNKTEIDVLAVSNKKVYVFEMKNYRGWVYGSENDESWTQVFNKFSKYKFYNPLRQNYAHSKATESYLNISEESIERVVVFSNSSKLAKINISTNNNVIQLKELNKFVRNIEKSNELLFDSEQRKIMIEKLIKTENVSDEIKAEHIRQVNELINKIKN